MRTLVIGDIHGCYAELQTLLEQAALTSDDQIIAIGDLVDRGTDSKQVLEFFRTTPNARSIQGNHERKHVRSFRGEIAPAPSQIITRHQIGEADYPAACAYMDSLPRYLELPEAILVHGFFEPDIPLQEQRETVIVGTLSGENYLKAHDMWPWYSLYKGEKPIIVGHRDYSEGQKQVFIHQDKVFAIDTRCCYGGSLTGILLPEFRLISIPSQGDHWHHIQTQYIDIINPN